MSKIKFVALGGLNEKGRECYVLEINDKIFVINAGALYTTKTIIGLTTVIPDFTYLKENSSKIKGIFITSAFSRCYGSLKNLLQECPMDAYCSPITASIINLELKSNIPFKTLQRMVPIKFDDVTVTPFKITNCLPESYGYVFSCGDENFIFLDDCIINASKNTLLNNDYMNIFQSTINKKNILFHAVGNVSEQSRFTTPDFQTQQFFFDTFNKYKERLMVAIYSHDIYKITSILNAAGQTGKKIVVINPVTIEIIKLMGINLAKYNIVTEDEAKDVEENIVYLIDSHRKTFFPFLEEILNGEFENLAIKKNDVFIFCNTTVNGTEKQEAEIFNLVHMCDVKAAIKLPKKYLDLSAGVEDLKFIVGFFKPNYIVPVNGLNRGLFDYQTQISKTGISKNNIILLKNGSVLEIEDGKINPKLGTLTFEPKVLNSEGNVEDPDGASSRFRMQENGVVVINVLVNAKTREMFDVSFVSYGVYNDNTFLEKEKGCKNEFMNTFKKLEKYYNNDGKVDIHMFKTETRKLIQKFYLKAVNKSPLLLTNLLFI